MNKYIIGAILIASLIVAGAIVSVNRSDSDVKVLSSDEVSEKIMGFINQELLQGAVVASLKEITKENGLYKMKIVVNEQEVDSYATLDGNLFFPDAFDLSEISVPEDSTNPTSCEDINKSNNPMLEAFVVSQCPFGIQAQRILNNVVKSIPSLANSIKVRYIGAIVNNKITAMHGDPEAQENLRQICLREEQADKYWIYIDCHIKNGEVDGCLTGIDTSGLNSCMNDNSRGLKYAQEDFDIQELYRVTGSPTLVLNGNRVSEYDFGGRTAQAFKSLICCGFGNQPSFCSQDLNADSAASGFSEDYSSVSSSSGECK